jgi:hypothetical protein
VKAERNNLWTPAACLLLLITAVLSFRTDVVSFEHRRRYEESDIAKLAAITRLDHSTIFFRGFTKSGYVQDGRFHSVVLKEQKESLAVPCLGRAVSRNGSRIAYIVLADDRSHCRVLLRDLEANTDRELGQVEQSWGPLAWSADDTEIAYVRASGVFALSTVNGRERTLARLPLRVNGHRPVGSWVLKSVEWFRHRSDLLVNADICIPTGSPGECHETAHVLILGTDDSRVLALGRGAAISPVRAQIAFLTATNAQLIDAGGSNIRRITTVPFTLLSIPPFLREATGWSEVQWSPQGDRLLFNNVLDEEFNGNYYLVEVRDGRRRRILKNTSLDVTDWR